MKDAARDVEEQHEAPGPEAGSRARERAVPAYRPGGEVTPEVALAFQKGAGNAALLRLIRPDRPSPAGRAAIQRDPQPAAAPPEHVDLPEEQVTGTPGTSRTLTAEDRKHLDEAKKALDDADRDIQGVKTWLEAFSNEGMPVLEKVGETYAKTCEIYATARKKHADFLTKAKAENAVQEQMLGMIVNTALSFVPNPKAMIEGALTELAGNAKTLASQVLGVATKIDISSSGAPPAAGTDWAAQVAFYKSYSESWKSAAKIGGHATVFADVSTKTGVLQERITGILDSGKTRTDATPAGIENNAKKIAGAAKAVGGLQGKIQGLIREFESMNLRLEALQPSEDEAEKEIWVRWIGSMRRTGVIGNLGDMNIGKVQDYLKKIGVWDQLGIDAEGWFSFRDEDLANFSAEAQTRVLEHRGKTFDVEAEGTTVKGRIPLEPRFPGVPAKLNKWMPKAKGSAMLVGATAPGKLEPMTFESAKSREDVIYTMFAKGMVTAVLEPSGPWVGEDGQPVPL